jgi:hypothetical protein
MESSHEFKLSIDSSTARGPGVVISSFKPGKGVRLRAMRHVKQYDLIQIESWGSRIPHDVLLS